MTITPFGYVFLSILLLAITLAVFVNKRFSRDRGSPNGWFFNFYMGAIVVSVTSLFILSVTLLVSQTYSWSVYPKYKSTIIDVNSEWVERDYTDDDEFSRSKMVEMHTAVLEFYDKDNELIRANNSVSSGGKPKIGEQITIAYQDGKLSEFSLRTVLVTYLGLGTMMILLGSISTGMVLFDFNKNTERVHSFGWGFVFYFVVPAGMFFLMCGMLYGLWDHHANNGDMPIWAQGLAIFFALVLFLSLITYVKNMWNKKINRGQV